MKKSLTERALTRLDRKGTIARDDDKQRRDTQRKKERDREDSAQRKSPSAPFSRVAISPRREIDFHVDHEIAGYVSAVGSSCSRIRAIIVNAARPGKKPRYSCLTAAAKRQRQRRGAPHHATPRHAMPRHAVLYTYVMNHPVHTDTHASENTFRLGARAPHAQCASRGAAPRRAAPQRTASLTSVTELVAHHFILFLGFHPW